MAKKVISFIYHPLDQPKINAPLLVCGTITGLISTLFCLNFGVPAGVTTLCLVLPPLLGCLDFFKEFWQKFRYQEQIALLDQIVNAAGLADYEFEISASGQRVKRAKFSVKIRYYEDSEKILLTFSPEGISHFEKLSALSDLISSAYGRPAYIVANDYTKFCYKISKKDDTRLEIKDEQFW